MGDGSLLAIRVGDVPCLRRTNRVRFKLLLKDATRALTDGLARSLSFLMHLQKCIQVSIEFVCLASPQEGCSIPVEVR